MEKRIIFRGHTLIRRARSCLTICSHPCIHDPNDSPPVDPQIRAAVESQRPLYEARAIHDQNGTGKWCRPAASSNPGAVPPTLQHKRGMNAAASFRILHPRGSQGMKTGLYHCNVEVSGGVGDGLRFALVHSMIDDVDRRRASIDLRLGPHFRPSVRSIKK